MQMTLLPFSKIEKSEIELMSELNIPFQNSQD